MKDNIVKALLKKTVFREGTRHRIRFGPMAGLYFRTNGLTGISPWYSGPERDHQTLFQTIVNRGDCVLDIGANWGSHTLFLAKLVGPEGKIHAFEPLPEAMEELKWHIQTNGLTNVETHPLALSDQNGQAVFIPGASSETSHLEAVDKEGRSAVPDSITVQTRTLDSYAETLRVDRIHLIKLDVEGAESRVLEGASRTIQLYRPHLIVDLHTPEQDLRVAALLDSWGYQLSRVGGNPIEHIDKSWPDPLGVWGSIHATPKE